MTYDPKSAVAFAKRETAAKPVYDAEFIDYHNSRSDDGAGILGWVAFVCSMIVFVTFIAMAVLNGITSTGPNCPGMDPSWLGKCEVAQ